MWSQTVFRFQEFYLGCRYGRIDPSAAVGERGEQAAARMLRQQGLVIVSKNVADRGGEIDLIAVDRKNRTVVFIEVKTHSSIKPGHPAERVDQKKQGRVTRAAMRYLRRKQLLGVAARFDVVAVWWPGGHPTPKRIEHYQSAFEAVGPYQFYA
jgi:putative endonuclease